MTPRVRTFPQRLPLLLIGLLVTLALSWAASVAIEWVGMATVWRSQGVEHSRRLLAEHWQYLNTDFRARWGVIKPVSIGHAALTGVAKAGQAAWHRAVSPVVHRPNWVQRWPVLSHAAGILEAAVNITQVFLIRLLLIVLMVPRLMLYTAVAAIAGLTLTDLRRAGGGGQYAHRYHLIKPFVAPSLTVGLALYLSFPGSVHPNTFLVPLMVIFAGTVFFATATYKNQA